MKQKNSVPIPTESDEQQSLFRWINWVLPKYPELELFHHITNEGKRSVYEGARLKREGLLKGVPDLHLPVAHGDYSSLYIELKRSKGGRVSKEQEERFLQLRKAGNFVMICYGWEEAKEAIEYYIKLPSKSAEAYTQWKKQPKVR